MKNSIFQKSANWLKKITFPNWLKLMIKEIWDIVYAIFLSVGKEYIRQLETKIMEVAQDNTLTNEQKFNIVFKYARTIGITIKDSALRLLIEAIVLYLKNRMAI